MTRPTLQPHPLGVRQAPDQGGQAGQGHQGGGQAGQAH